MSWLKNLKGAQEDKIVNVQFYPAHRSRNIDFPFIRLMLRINWDGPTLAQGVGVQESAHPNN